MTYETNMTNPHSEPYTDWVDDNPYILVSIENMQPIIRDREEEYE